MNRSVMNGQLTICWPECRSHLLDASGNDSDTNTLHHCEQISRPSESFVMNKLGL
jgi:hypothetical protein